jgi:hypothetical protein
MCRFAYRPPEPEPLLEPFPAAPAAAPAPAPKPEPALSLGLLGARDALGLPPAPSVGGDLDFLHMFDTEPALSPALPSDVLTAPAGLAAGLAGAGLPPLDPAAFAPYAFDPAMVRLQAAMAAAARAGAGGPAPMALGAPPAPTPFAADAFGGGRAAYGAACAPPAAPRADSDYDSEASPAPTAGPRRARSPATLAAQEERTKKRRRESARRSRQRKTSYVAALEAENAALKAEVLRLRREMAGAGLAAAGLAAPGALAGGAGFGSATYTHGATSGVCSSADGAALLPVLM